LVGKNALGLLNK